MYLNASASHITKILNISPQSTNCMITYLPTLFFLRILCKEGMLQETWLCLKICVLRCFFSVTDNFWEYKRNMELWASSHCNQKCLCPERCNSHWQQHCPLIPCKEDTVNTRTLWKKGNRAKNLIEDKQPSMASLPLSDTCLRRSKD